MIGGWAKNCTILICKGFLLPWLNGFSIWVPLTESCNIDTLTAAIQMCTLCALTLLTYIYIFRSFRSCILCKHLWSLQVSNTFDDILILTQCCWFYASDWNSYVCKSSIIDIENISQQLTGLHAEKSYWVVCFQSFWNSLPQALISAICFHSQVHQYVSMKQENQTQCIPHKFGVCSGE